MKINILDVRDTDEIGGPGKTILETAKRLDKNRFTNHLAVFQIRTEYEETSFIKEARKIDIPLHIIKSHNQYDPAIIFKLLKVIKKNNIHILHTHEPKSDIIGYLVKQLCNVHLVSTIHGYIKNSFRDHLYNKIDKFILRRFDRVIVVSDLMKKQMHQSGISIDKLYLVYNSIVIENYINLGRATILENITKRDFRDPIIATIGRLNPEKGHKDFIEAANTVLKKGYDASFVLVGDGVERGKLQDMARNLGLESKILFTGYIQDIVSIYRNIDLMVLPSYTEGLPNVVLESLLMEVPVIATSVGGTTEIIEHNETGVIIRPGRPTELADKIVDFIRYKDDFKKMAIEGRADVIKRFNFHNRCKIIEELYVNLV